MTWSTWLSFFLVALITALSPGPAILLAVSNATTQGTRKAMLSSAGNALGILLVSAAAMMGVGTLLKTSATLFFGLKVVGPGYLICLGVKQWCRAGKSPLADARRAPAATGKTGWRLFQEG